MTGVQTCALPISSGTVNGSDVVGGLVGLHEEDGRIQNASANATVNGSGLYVGGLVGYNAGTIQDASTRGSVTGSDSVGGLVG